MKMIIKRYNKKKHNSEDVKRIYGNNIVVTEFVSNEDPFAGFNKDMREEVWNGERDYDY